jgi:putative DNA primase/helicase
MATTSHFRTLCMMKHNDLFFNEATKGINTPSGFYAVKDKTLVCRKASELDRARFMLNFAPEPDCEITEFMNMLKYAFANSFEEQVRQLRMMFGLALIGMQPLIQRACFLYGVGGSGKSTILRILEALVPPELVSHVSPLEFESDYKKAALADKWLNLVPEIDKTKLIPSTDFKAVTGEDKISARQPFERVFYFTPEAGNCFNGNFYITTIAQSDGFYRRWAIIRFFYAKPENEQDPMLTKRIIEKELPGILSWALDGVRDYLNNGLYLSPTHEASMIE